MIRAYVVVEEFGVDDPIPIGDCDFVDVPRAGEVLLLQAGGEQFLADITSIIHRAIQAGDDSRSPSLQVVAMRRPTGEGH